MSNSIREKLIGALRAAIGPKADETVQTLESVQSLTDTLNTLSNRADAADTFLATQTKLKIKQLKSENVRGMYDKWISRIENTGLSARDSAEMLKNEVLKLQSEKLGHPAAAPRVTTASLPIPPQTLAAPTVPISSYPMTDEFNGISDPIDRTAFYRKNKTKLDSEHRRQCREEAAAVPSKEPTSTGDIIQRLASIGDSVARVSFYRANKSAIDLAYTKLDTNQ